MLKQVKKYWYFVTLHWQEAFMYRGEMVVWTLVDAFPLLSMLLLWVSVYRYGNQIGDFSLNTMVTYYVVGSILFRLTEAHIEEEVIRQINSGEIAKFFLRPLNAKVYWITAELGWKLMSFFLTLVPITTLIFLFKPEWLQFHSWYQVAVIAIFALFGYIIDSCFSLLISAMTFFFEQGNALSHAKWAITALLGGSALPLSMYPDKLEGIIRLTPFPLLFATPMEFYLGIRPAAELLPQIGLGVFWALALMAIVTVVWERAEQEFTAVGG